MAGICRFLFGVIDPTLTFVQDIHLLYPPEIFIVTFQFRECSTRVKVGLTFGVRYSIIGASSKTLSGGDGSVGRGKNKEVPAFRRMEAPEKREKVSNVRFFPFGGAVPLKAG